MNTLNLNNQTVNFLNDYFTNKSDFSRYLTIISDQKIFQVQTDLDFSGDFMGCLSNVYLTFFIDEDNFSVSNRFLYESKGNDSFEAIKDFEEQIEALLEAKEDFLQCEE